MRAEWDIERGSSISASSAPFRESLPRTETGTCRPLSALGQKRSSGGVCFRNGNLPLRGMHLTANPYHQRFNLS